MKKNVNYIARETFDSIVARSGLPVEERKSWTLVGNYSASGPRVYIPKQKQVGRIDLSCFTVPAEEFGVTDLGGESFGAVHQQLDFTKDGTEILVNFEKLLDHMKTLARPASPPRKSSSPRPASSQPATPDDPAAARKKKILARAQELMGAPTLLPASQAVAQAQAEAAA